MREIHQTMEHLSGEFIEDPNAKKHEEGRVRVQRVWIDEDDYKQFGITDDCEKCFHNHRWGVQCISHDPLVKNAGSAWK